MVKINSEYFCLHVNQISQTVFIISRAKYCVHVSTKLVLVENNMFFWWEVQYVLLTRGKIFSNIYCYKTIQFWDMYICTMYSKNNKIRIFSIWSHRVDQVYLGFIHSKSKQCWRITCLSIRGGEGGERDLLCYHNVRTQFT